MIFITGPKLPQHCIDGSMVSSLNGKEAILVGCKENPEKIYRLRWSNENILEWILMRQKLKYPRSNGVAMLIPDALTYCFSGRAGWPEIAGQNSSAINLDFHSVCYSSHISCDIEKSAQFHFSLTGPNQDRQ